MFLLKNAFFRAERDQPRGFKPSPIARLPQKHTLFACTGKSIFQIVRPGMAFAENSKTFGIRVYNYFGRTVRVSFRSSGADDWSYVCSRKPSELYRRKHTSDNNILVDEPILRIILRFL